jgi:hypothetical protein
VVPDGAYLFSTLTAMPSIPDVDYMFGAGTMPDDAGHYEVPSDFGTAAEKENPPQRNEK